MLPASIGTVTLFLLCNIFTFHHHRTRFWDSGTEPKSMNPDLILAKYTREDIELISITYLVVR